MKKSLWHVALSVVICTVIVGVPSITPRAVSAQNAGPNLLVEGGFEASPPWPLQGGAGDVYIAPGWQAYYLESPPTYAQVPSNCSDTPKMPACYWMRPRFSHVDSAAFANRVHGGVRAQKCYSDGRMHEAGLIQRVTGIKPGTTFTVNMTGTGDPDLYVRWGAAPTVNQFSCRPYLDGATETCSLTVPANQTAAFVMVRGYTAATYSLAINWTAP